MGKPDQAGAAVLQSGMLLGWVTSSCTQPSGGQHLNKWHLVTWASALTNWPISPKRLSSKEGKVCQQWLSYEKGSNLVQEYSRLKNDAKVGGMWILAGRVGTIEAEPSIHWFMFLWTSIQVIMSVICYLLYWVLSLYSVWVLLNAASWHSQNREKWNWGHGCLKLVRQWC